jgi:protein-disulfide isomerase
LDNYKKGNLSVFSPEVLGPSYYNMNTASAPQVEIATADDPFIGPVDAKVVVVEFQNYLCPHCQQEYPILDKVINEYSNRVKFVFRDYPVEFAFPGSELAAQAGECADDQGKYWEYVGLLYDNQVSLNNEETLKNLAKQLMLDEVEFNNCLTTKKYYAEVMMDLQAGATLGVSGTPTFYIQGVKVANSISYANFKKVLDEQLELAK